VAGRPAGLTARTGGGCAWAGRIAQIESIRVRRASESGRTRVKFAGAAVYGRHVRTIPDTFDRHSVAAIDALLASIAAQERVTIPFAVESGSRAWGFPSPDSDYDCRFVYVRSVEDYLSPWPVRDVIERVPDAVLDVNGWDLTKALQLLVKGNAVVIEWMCSPVAYARDVAFVDELLALAGRIGDRALIGRHYLNVGRRQWERSHIDGGAMHLKRLFYALRPALALRWLDMHPEQIVPPMTLAALVEQTALPASVVEATNDLVALKSMTRELGRGVVPPVLRVLIEAELQDLPWLGRRRTAAERADAHDAAAEFFRRAVRTHAWVDAPSDAECLD